MTAAELAAVIAMWQAVGDAGGEDKFSASKLSLGNPSDSDLREVLGLEDNIICPLICLPYMSSYKSALYVVV